MLTFNSGSSQFSYLHLLLCAPPSSPTMSSASDVVTKLFETGRPIDISVSGYLLTREMMKHLCLLAYGATQAELDELGPIDYATIYWSERHPIESPCIIPITTLNRSSNLVEEMWILIGKAAYLNRGASPPKLSYDKETREYLNAWFPSKMLKLPEFEGIRFVQTQWPRGLIRASMLLQHYWRCPYHPDLTATGIIMTSMQVRVYRKHYEHHERDRKNWIKEMEEHGEDPVLVRSPANYA